MRLSGAMATACPMIDNLTGMLTSQTGAVRTVYLSASQDCYN